MLCVASGVRVGFFSGLNESVLAGCSESVTDEAGVAPSATAAGLLGELYTHGLTWWTWRIVEVWVPAEGVSDHHHPVLSDDDWAALHAASTILVDARVAPTVTAGGAERWVRSAAEVLRCNEVYDIVWQRYWLGAHVVGVGMGAWLLGLQPGLTIRSGGTFEPREPRDAPLTRGEVE